jgi:leucyl/phenylalanyl-tRNA--protein transferase
MPDAGHNSLALRNRPNWPIVFVEQPKSRIAMRHQATEIPVTPELILAGYGQGVFPMADDDGTIYWFSPDPRTVFELDRFHVPRTVRQLITRNIFEIRIDTAFDEVVAACAAGRRQTWISPQIMGLYQQLHRLGFAHSVEAWQGSRLAGGLYGVALGGAFFGESMFFRISGASKVALVALVERLKQRGYKLLDTQWTTPHLARFGAIEIPRRTYLNRLRRALLLPCRFADR